MFDLGTGLRYCGSKVPESGPFRGTCLLTHMHWDHVQGLPFFVPTLRPNSHFDIYGPVQEDGRTVRDVFEAIIQPPMFPISVADLPGTLNFHDVADDDFTIGSLQVRSRFIPHIGNTLGFRVSVGGSSVAYLSDHQMPTDGSFSMTQGARELCEGVDLLIHDSQYTPEEFVKKSTWGHCTVDYAMWVAQECGVKTLALFHHDPTRSDEDLDAVVTSTRSRIASPGFDVIAAAENQVISLPVRC